MSWDRMCMKKSDGDMRFRKLHDFNLALLGKQAWRLVTIAESMVNRVFKVRYYPDGKFLTARIGANPNFVGQALWQRKS